MTTHLQAIGENEARWLSVVQSQVRPLRYGVVQIVVHDGEVVQIERTEKVRLRHPESADLQFTPPITR